MDEQSTQEIEKHTKRSLKRYRKCVECVERLELRLQTLDERITTIKSPSLSGMPRGGTPVTLDDLMSDKMDLEKRIERMKAKRRDLKVEVCAEIDKLEDYRFCEVLEAYFIDGKSFGDIAEDLGYSERHIISLYSEAISKLSLLSQ